MAEPTKAQLYAVAIDTENIFPLELRYAAARELQSRAFSPDDMLLDLVRLIPQKTPKEIAEYLGVPRRTIVQYARRLGLKFRHFESRDDRKGGMNA